jgi:AraC-like DNA-binding protein
MSSRLARVEDWESLANACQYSPASLAKRRDVSVRQLERFFQGKFGKTPRSWMHEVRLRRALELLKDGAAAKEVAYLLAYRDGAHFCNAFKRYYKITPSEATSQ